MDKKNLMPQQAQPIERITTGQLPTELAELSEEELCGDTSREESASVLPQRQCREGVCCNCSYEGEDAE
jgi:bacteriocin leader peptide (microcyclamide/patellamide family)